MSHSPSVPSRSGGAALVVVLAMLVLISTVVIAFFASVATETGSSVLDADTGRVRQMAAAAIQVVQSQIQDGTHRGANIAWASQPGMIRNYDNAGNPAGYFKLYSWQNMSSTTDRFDPSSSGEQVPVDWFNQPNVFVDLNEPSKARGQSVYPIAYPDAVDTDPAAGTTSSANAVDQFGLVNPPLQGGTAGNPLPMPVQWLYLLQDGSLGTPTASGTGGKAVTISGVSATNPIVGRIAFWADDETSKVNLNTAGEGTFYDLPRFFSPNEIQLSKSPPPIGEFQRYPGHPAMTSLSAVFSGVLPSPQDVTASNYSQLAAYYQLTPRVNAGGTQGGTVTTNVQSNGTVAQVPRKIDRLYPSVDEVVFTPATLSPFRNDVTAFPTPDPNNADTDLAAVIEKRKFFLTTSSRAAETNLFNLPRVTVWPLSTDSSSAHRTAEDSLLAFCSTIGGQPFAFQRADPTSLTSDFRLSRNQAIFQYLQRLTGKQIPGYGGSLSGKYGTAERDQLLTEIFDYIRSVNLNDPLLISQGGIPYTPVYFGDPSNPQEYYTNPGAGQVVPTIDSAPGTGNPVRGLGRFPVIDQAILSFYATPDTAQVAGSDSTKYRTPVQAVLLLSLQHPALGFMKVQENFKVEVTVTSGSESFVCSIPSNSNASLENDGHFMFFGGGTGHAKANRNARRGGNGRSWGGNHEVSPFVLFNALANDEGDNSYGLYGQTIPVIIGHPNTLVTSPNSDYWSLKGGAFKVIIKTLAGDVVQTYNFQFPDVPILPIPAAYQHKPVADQYGPADPPYLGYQTISGGRGAGGVGDYTTIMGATETDGDVVRGISLVNGDIRRLSATAQPPASWYAPEVGYGGSLRRVHGLRQSAGAYYPTSYALNFMDGVLYPGEMFPQDPSTRPFIRMGINGVFISDSNGQPVGPNIPGDWDTGFGNYPDGAYINKADEGCAYDPSQPPAYFDYDGKTQSYNLTSPNRQIPSPVMFGSLPVNTTRGTGWQTLLFRPDFGSGHPGAASPRDDLLLDLFQMPIVEPYAISEPLSTAGKINLNYQILPFSYIKRDTGVRAVLLNERITAMPNTFKDYKDGYQYSLPQNAAEYANYRFPVNLQETLKGFEAVFNSGEIFRSASQICDLPLVPNAGGATYDNINSWWTAYQRTGDNLKERPYATIYPRVTTKSNTFRVHFRVQVLRRPLSRNTGAAAATFEAGVGGDSVVSEMRGSAILERYIDPNQTNPALPDFADPSVTQTVDDFARFRTVNFSQFNP